MNAMLPTKAKDEKKIVQEGRYSRGLKNRNGEYLVSRTYLKDTSHWYSIYDIGELASTFKSIYI